MPLEDKYLERFIQMLTVVQGASPHTVDSYRRDLLDFSRTSPAAAQVQGENIRTYLQNLSQKKLSARTQARRLSSLRRFFKFLVERGDIAHDPCLDVDMPKLPQPLPKAPTCEEVLRLLKAGTVDDTPFGLRLQAILFTLYATGMRVSELAGLKLEALNSLDEGILQVTGKGGKTRLVPIGDKACAALQIYIERGRPHLPNPDSSWLFASPRKNKALSRQRIFQMIQALGRSVNLELSPHSLRHAFATHLLENEADLQSVQLMLGHSDLATTQIYTKVTGKKLGRVVQQYHPLGAGKNDER